MLASFGKMPTTSARRLTSFSIPARVVNYLIVPPACMRARRSAAGCSGSPRGQPSLRARRSGRLRMGYGQEPGGASLFAVSRSRAMRHGVVKEISAEFYGDEGTIVRGKVRRGLNALKMLKKR
jgi:hypothetical protein